MPIDAGRSGLLVFDMLEHHRAAIAEAGAMEPVRRLMQACRDAGAPVLYARGDHRADGADLAQAPRDADKHLRPLADPTVTTGRAGDDRAGRRLPHHASGTPGAAVIAELAPQPGDYDVPKHRWNAFHQTHLELSLRTRGIRTVMIVGGSTHVGIASTVYAGRDLDFDMVVVRDCLTGLEPERRYFVERIFPRMCRVRSSDELIAALAGGGGGMPAVAAER